MEPINVLNVKNSFPQNGTSKTISETSITEYKTVNSLKGEIAVFQIIFAGTNMKQVKRIVLLKTISLCATLAGKILTLKHYDESQTPRPP